MPVVALISGRGSNLQALMDTAANIGIRLAAVISDQPDAAGLGRAARAGIPTETVRAGDHPNREQYDRQLTRSIDRYRPGLVVLAGFMRILSAGFVDHYSGRLLNIHPSLLPAYRGLHTHRRVLDAGEIEHGCTVHFVTEQLDGGPIVVQSRVAVRPQDDEQTLAERVLAREHLIYPLAVGWFASGRLRLVGGRPLLDDNPIPASGMTYEYPGTAE